MMTMMLPRMNMTMNQMGMMKMKVMTRKENTMRRIRVKSLIDKYHNTN